MKEARLTPKNREPFEVYRVVRSQPLNATASALSDCVGKVAPSPDRRCWLLMTGYEAVPIGSNVSAVRVCFQPLEEATGQETYDLTKLMTWFEDNRAPLWKM
jgi:hypothetical protein